MFIKTGALAAALALLATAAAGQNSRHEVSGNFTYSFTTSTTFQGPINITENNQAVLKPSSGFGFLASYQFHWKPRHGFEANYGYLSNTQAYQVNNTLTGLPLPSISIKTHIQEVTGAYVYQTRKIWHFNPFLEGGAGVLFFSPQSNNNVTVGLSSETKAVYLYGGGADLKLSPKAAVRVQYRGLLYHPGTFNAYTLVGFSGGSIAHIAQPSVGIVYHF
jgi:hypothetical protein